MKKQTVDLIIRIGIEVAEWLVILLKEKGGKDDSKNTSKKKLKNR